MTIASSDPAFAFARLIERECWKQEIRRACLAFANSAQNRRDTLGWVARGEQGQPPMSQLGGLRGQLTRLRGANDVTAIQAWLAHLEANTRRRDRWPNGSIGLVRQFLTDTQQIWNVLNPSSWPTLTNNSQAELRQELWALAVRTFFDACIRAHKRELEVANGA
jgi:CRISPR-associated protein Csx10